MLNIFKKKFVDETLEEQKNDVLNLNKSEFSDDTLIKEILSGDSCDEIPNSTGDFGRTLTNPVPVNGPVGEFKYLNRLRCSNGFIFHRLGSVNQEDIQGNIDVFEIVSVDGRTWDVLYLHFYHPRRSTKLPTGFTFSEFHVIYSRVLFGYGTNQTDRDFPFGIAKFIEMTDVMGMGKTLARNFNKVIEDKSKFVRTKEQKQKLSLATKLIEHTTNSCVTFTNLTKQDLVRIETCFKNDNLKEAENFLKLKNRQHKDDSKVLYYLGFLYRNLEDYEKSVHFYIKAIKRDPFNSILFYNLGIVYQMMGDYNSSIKSLEKSVSIKPNFSEALNSLALTYKKQGDPENTLKYYNQCFESLFQNIYNQIKQSKITEIDDVYMKNSSKKWFEAAINTATKNSSEDGLKEILFPTSETVEKMDNTNSFMEYTMYDKGDIRYVLPTYFSSFYKILKSDLFYSNVLNNIGTHFAENGDIKKARECFEESIDFIPNGLSFPNPHIGIEQLE